MGKVSIIGLDLAKRSFRAHGALAAFIHSVPASLYKRSNDGVICSCSNLPGMMMKKLLFALTLLASSGAYAQQTQLQWGYLAGFPSTFEFNVSATWYALSSFDGVKFTIPASTALSGLDSGVSAALGNNINSTDGFKAYGGSFGMPTRTNLSNATALPNSAGVGGLGTGAATELGVPVNAVSGVEIVNSGELPTVEHCLQRESNGITPAGGVCNTVRGGGTVTSGNQYQLAYYVSTGTAVSELTSATAGQTLVANASAVPTFVALSGDCTLSSAGATTCTKKGETAFPALATLTPGTGVALAPGYAVGSPFMEARAGVGQNSNFLTATARSDPLSSYCFIGDGNSHALSTVTSCGGLNTTGWTLAQWQAILPAAAALTDEIDGDAINSFIAAQGSNPVNLRVHGNARINTSIASCSGNLYVSGDSQFSSIMVATASVTAFKHCQSASPPTNSQWHVTGLKIICNNIACGDVADVTLNNGTEPSLLWREVSAYALGSGVWSNGLMLTGAGGSRISDSVIGLSSSGVAYGGDCISFTPATPFSDVFMVANTHIGNCAIGLNLVSSGSGQGPEGIFLTNLNADNVITAINETLTSTTYQPPEVVIAGMESSFFKAIYQINVTGTAHVSSIVIRDGWFIQLAPNALSGTITPPTGLIDLGNAQQVLIENNNFVQESGATLNYLINVQRAANDWVVRDNTMPVYLGLINNGIINIASGATNFLEINNDWAYASARVNNAAWNTPTVASDSWVRDQSSGSCHILGLDRRGTIGTGRAIQCAAKAKLTPASNAATLTLPTKVFSSRAAPQLVMGTPMNNTSAFLGGIVDSSWFWSSANGQWSVTVETPTNTGTVYEFHYIATGE